MFPQFWDAKDNRLLKGHQISVQALKWWKIPTVTSNFGLLEDLNHVVCCGWGTRHSVGHSHRKSCGEVPSEIQQVPDSWVCPVSLCHLSARLLQLLTSVCWHRAYWIREFFWSTGLLTWVSTLNTIHKRYLLETHLALEVVAEATGCHWAILAPLGSEVQSGTWSFPGWMFYSGFRDCSSVRSSCAAFCHHSPSVISVVPGWGTCLTLGCDCSVGLLVRALFFLALYIPCSAFHVSIQYIKLYM